MIFTLAILFCLIVSVNFVNAEDRIEISSIGEAYGFSTGSAKWNPEADLNGDGIINIYDLALATKIVSTNSENYGPLQGETTVISVEPTNTSVGSTGKKFSTDIDIIDANETWAWGFNLTWNPSLLRIIDPNVAEGDFLSQNGNWSTYLTYYMNQTEGWLIVGCTLLEEPTSYPTGSGTLATIDFTVLNVGNSTLDLHNTTLVYKDGITGYEHTSKDGYFVVCPGDINRDGEVDNIDLGHFASAYGSNPSSTNWNLEADLNNNGVVDVFDLFIIGRNYGKTCAIIGGTSSPASRLYVEPETISVPSATGTSFDVNLSMNYVENLYAYKFKLKYDPNVLSATRMTYSYLNSPVQVWKNVIDNNKGEIQFEINSNIGAKPKSDKGNLATITFQIKDLGKTDIDIYSSKLGDVKNLIGHDVEDGYFTNYIPADVDIDPNTLNLKDKGKWITAYIKLNEFVCGNGECEVELGENIDNCPIDCPSLPPAPSASISAFGVSNINISTVKLWYGDNYVPAASGEFRNDTMVVKFDRAAIQSFLAPSESVELTVTGETLYNSRYVDFRGTDLIRVISK